MIDIGGHFLICRRVICCFDAPCFNIRVPSSVVFAAFDVEVYAQIFSWNEYGAVDLITPNGDADFFRVCTVCFNDEILFLPRSVFAGTGLHREQGVQLCSDLHGVIFWRNSDFFGIRKRESSIRHQVWVTAMSRCRCSVLIGWN